MTQQQAPHQPAHVRAPVTGAVGRVLRRACACGQHAEGGECEECRGKRQGTLQRAAVSAAAGEAEVPPIVHDVLRSPGQPLDAATRAYMEPRFGHDFSGVRLHTDNRAADSARSVNALAYTVGNHVAFDAGRYRPESSEGCHLLAHELAHVVQQAPAGASGTLAMSQSRTLERQATDAATRAVRPSASFLPIRSVGAAGRHLQAKPSPGPSPELDFAIRMAIAKPSMTAADARDALDIYKRLTLAQRTSAFASFYPSGEITVLLRAVTPADAAGPYRAEMAQLLRWVEEAETRLASGMTDEQMAEAQAKFKKAEAEKAAQSEIDAKTPKGAAPPKATPKDVEAARKKKVEQTSIAPTTVTTWDKKPKAEQDAWKKRGAAVIKKVVAHAAKNHPELKLTEKHFLADFGGVEKRGQRVLAYGGQDALGNRLAVFGFRFVEAAEASPAYVMSVVVHEVFGHPEYGPYGSEYHLALYDKAQAKIPGYTQPAAGSAARRSEIDAYAYRRRRFTPCCGRSRTTRLSRRRMPARGSSRSTQQAP